jgi:hypothetical protein
LIEHLKLRHNKKAVLARTAFFDCLPAMNSLSGGAFCQRVNFDHRVALASRAFKSLTVENTKMPAFVINNVSLAKGFGDL